MLASSKTIDLVHHDLEFAVSVGLVQTGYLAGGEVKGRKQRPSFFVHFLLLEQVSTFSSRVHTFASAHFHLYQSTSREKRN